MIAVSRDYVGIREAALELFTEAMAGGRSERTLRAELPSEDRDRILEASSHGRSLSPGYYSRVSYLLSLQQEMELGVGIPASEMLASELDGLAILRDARTEFLRGHPPCFRCGSPNEKFTSRCASCGEELRESKVPRGER